MTPPRPHDALFEAVRESASRDVWSRGVELARAGAAVQLAESDGEVQLGVAVAGALVHPTVTLTPEDEDWHCDCREIDDPCSHVAAAVIALRRAGKEGRSDLAGGKAGRLQYALTTHGRSLHIERLVLGPGAAPEPMRSTIGALATGRVRGPSVAATQADLGVERALGTRLWGELARGTWPRLLDALSRCGDVTLDGEAVRVSGESLRPLVRVEDREGDFWIGFVRDPAIRARYDGGVVLRGGVLHPAGGPTGLLGRDLDRLERGELIPEADAARLVTELLPRLADRVTLDIRTDRLPRTAEEPVRIRVEVSRDGATLSLLPTLVYGDPVCARVDAGRLVHLGGPVPIRDPEGEERLTRRLQQELGAAPGHRLRFVDEEAVAAAERLARFSGEVVGDAHGDFFTTGPLVPSLSVGASDFDLDFSVPVSHADADADADGQDATPRRASPDAVLAAWREGRSLVPLLDGGFAPLPRDWLSRLGPLLDDLLAARAANGTLPAFALPDLARLCQELDAPPPPAFESLRALVDGFDAVPQPELPADLTATLRPYQVDGVRWLRFLRRAGLGALLADDMGLGKTLQTLCAIDGRSLVVAPTSVLFGWAAEIRRFRPALRVCVYHGPRRRLDPDADVTLTSYALLRLDVATLAEQPWDCIVLDEAQNVKNPDSQVAQAAYQLRAPFRVALSGTPVENRLEELWSQLHFTNPGLLGGRRQFEQRSARPIAEGDRRALARLRQRIRPFMLRRTKSEVARDLPPRTDVVLHCVLSDAERAVYDAVRAATQRDVVARLRGGGNVMAALEALLRLRQACCHVGLVPGQEAETSSKLELLRDELETAVADGHKALVFSQWTSLLDRVQPELRAAGIEHLRLDGSTRDRGKVVDTFQSEDGPPVLLISLRAGGTGLNLTAADHVFLLDPWWNPAVEDQAADRTHRIGQDRPVLVYRMVARDTVEERILALQESKRALAQAALGDGGAGAGLTREDLLALLD